MIEIKQYTIPELFYSINFPNLVEEYVKECLTEGLLDPCIKFETYKKLEETSNYKVFVAIKEGKLIGFITVLSSVLAHHDRVFSLIESWFVAKEYRKTGAGIRLLIRVEKYAKTIRSFATIVNAPLYGDLIKTMDKHREYKGIYKVFLKVLK